ncbi:MAG: hypothetical protein EOO89_11900 [Pedobacter sp.]|nr:MAG: hypothetical protein EOO89_11900 [Pedobacter sp.]
MQRFVCCGAWSLACPLLCGWSSSQGSGRKFQTAFLIKALHQQQTLAIAKKLSERGVMVLAILHDINLASQYADRIIMLKEGRKCYDGSPAEVLISSNIDDVFKIEADIFTNPITQKSFFIPKDITIELG